MLYDAEVCTIYKAKNGFVVKCPPDKDAKPAKGDAPSVPGKDEVFLAKNTNEVLKIVRNELNGDSENYEKAFKEATSDADVDDSKSKK